MPAMEHQLVKQKLEQISETVMDIVPVVRSHLATGALDITTATVLYGKLLKCVASHSEAAEVVIITMVTMMSITMMAITMIMKIDFSFDILAIISV